MKTTLQQFRSDQALWIAEMIEKFGHAIMCVDTGECSVPGCRCEPSPVPWSYTIGLSGDGLAEFVAFGLDQHGSVRMLNWAAAQARSPDGRVAPGGVGHLDGRPVRFDQVPVGWVLDGVDPMGQWWAHYGPGRPDLGPPPVIQCVWADAEGRFPDDPECDPAVVACQPVGERLLGAWTDSTRPRNRAERRSRKRR